MTMRAPAAAPWTSVLHWLRQKAAPGARLRSDSRMVQAGDIFFALPGLRSQPQTYVDDALKRGASAVLLAEAPGDPLHSAVLPLPALASVAGELAAAYLDYPSRRLPVVAVTGTNGKTSVSHWIAQAWPEPAAVIGTLGAGFIAEAKPLETFGLTTPDAVRLQQLLADLAEQGASLIAIEASSIGLDQGRLQGLEPAVAVFTNLSRDHLDYHPDMQAYAQAKASLFAMLGAGLAKAGEAPSLAQAVINADDRWALRMIEACPPGCPLWFYSVQDSPAAAKALASTHQAYLLWAAYTPADHQSMLRWSLFEPGNPEACDQGCLQLGLMGRFNAANALAVACTLMALGQQPQDAIASLSLLKPVPGRMQCIGSSATPLVVIDYAHTPDAVQQVLLALRPVAEQRQGRLHCLLGAGGDRDPGKRHDMGAQAIGAADTLYLTSDNPRYEDPGAICEALKAGALSACPEALQGGKRLHVELDRAVAIDQVIAKAGACDVILLAGKGHENYQEIRGQRLDFDDQTVARQALMTHWSLAGQA
ncbi:MAG: UDP-N-acetylmuramoyl-L-alanyl-D-glutamate--2,6-diaminopimelate ligase [Betaproteobacteria bacterium]|nr:UDP-N-acetylmuramoyl-L-alanyl-D-glutamate--2,6-diaminopimelate ligase [Pseudomonadota bacterium]NBP34731.1 UDP-N-acetylmuramoyl-L-alanyl-D-glutamate--2,6-diaminopimelate ligase [Betaproteobacteria bacterium]NBP37666.1 UDP-N-acetylmuramoyl-L-alanyl-D-glutamate--2,6-diaminopimelate ligase [Betaproteobacteria bacterium]NBS38778.1 UDP-N-acetylmuramoyl-L-alanyl-D-glutamate--2,6-diaminopimelate ligase [Betaproteobacteria bacterium]NBT80717.1 UDP-N-acetylmuramoyl-L-alanyl-D-glutamate--2,6-diaminopi